MNKHYRSKVQSTVEQEQPKEIIEEKQQYAYNGMAGSVVESEDISKWEMETEPLLDKIFHKLLGELETEQGVWERDKRLSRSMNELGATEFINELRSRFNINMQMSELSIIDIKTICAITGKNYANKLEDNYSIWEVNYSQSNLESIAWQLVHALYIFLQIAKDGGMKAHREKRGIKSYFQPQAEGVI